MKSKFYTAVAIALLLFINFKSFSQANTSLSNLVSPTAINHSLTPGTTNYVSLGSGSVTWKNLYLSNGVYINNALILSAPRNTNIAIGARALYLATSSDHLIAIGDSTFYNNTTGARGTAVGSFSLYKNTTGDNNTTVGYQTLFNTTTGSSNVATGMQALYTNTTGSNNIANGAKALYSNTTGYSNVAIGIKALYSNTTGKQSVAMGDSALYKSTGGQNVAIGSKALYNTTTGTYNTALGYKANVNSSSGTNATAIGSSAYAACSNCVVLGSVNGTNGAASSINVGIGTTTPKAALHIIGTKLVSLASPGYLQLGDSTGYNMGMDYNQIQARYSGSSASLYLNYSGGSVYAGNSTNSTYGISGSGIYGVYGTGSTSSGKGVFGYINGGLGDALHGEGNGTTDYGVYAYSAQSYGLFALTQNSTSYAGYFSGSVYSTGTFTGSDEKLKQNITDVSTAMSIINQLKPKYYNFRQDGSYKKMNLPQGKHYGLIAQDVEKVLPGLVKDTKFDVDRATPDGPQTPPDPKNPSAQSVKPAVAKTGEVIDFKAVNYTELIPIIIKGMQEMNAEKDAAINDLQNQINQLKAMIVSSANNNQSTFVPSASMAQNIPNPFANSTTINYSLPQSYSSARIIITDKKGVALKQLSLNSKGSGSISVDASILASGAYQYSLYVNGKLIDTKQMVLSR